METGQVTELAPTESRARGATIDELYVHGPMLLAAARMITLDNDEAEDLVQTTFEIAIRHIGSRREPRALRAWLLRIQTREAFRVVRRVRRLVRLDGHVRELESPGADLAQREDMRRALLTLPRRTRAAIALHYLAGLSIEETANVMRVSENTTRSQCKTGLARLREELRDG